MEISKGQMSQTNSSSNGGKVKMGQVAVSNTASRESKVRSKTRVKNEESHVKVNDQSPDLMSSSKNILVSDSSHGNKQFKLA